MSQLDHGYFGRRDRRIPRLLQDNNRCGVPWFAVLVSGVLIILAFMSTRNAPSLSKDVTAPG